jgi:hypothetical protein
MAGTFEVGPIEESHRVGPYRGSHRGLNVQYTGSVRAG